MNKAEVLDKFLNSDPADGKVLVGSGMSEGLDLKGDKGRWQVILTIPYPSYGDAWVRRKAKAESHWYTWAATQELVQKFGRISRGPDDWGVTYILDSRFESFFCKARDYWPAPVSESIQL